MNDTTRAYPRTAYEAFKDAAWRDGFEGPYRKAQTPADYWVNVATVCGFIVAIIAGIWW